MIAPDAALDRLRAGNRRFCSSTATTGPRDLGRRRREVATGQQPFAIVLGCADSRVPPEVIFDEGLGDLFVVRLAGNLVTSEGLGSLEFATGVLGARLIVVLGHSSCGAVSAALGDGLPEQADLAALVKAIRDGLDDSGDDLAAAVRANVVRQVDRLRRHFDVPRDGDSDQLAIVGAEYDLETGIVDFL